MAKHTAVDKYFFFEVHCQGHREGQFSSWRLHSKVWLGRVSMQTIVRMDNQHWHISVECGLYTSVI